MVWKGKDLSKFLIIVLLVYDHIPSFSWIVLVLSCVSGTLTHKHSDHDGR